MTIAFLYLLTVMLWTAVLFLVETHKGATLELRREDVAFGGVLLLIWPITLCILIPIVLYVQDRDRKIELRYDELLKAFQDEDYREVAVSINERDLKFLLKLSRNNEYKDRFKPQLIEILRAELLNRATEKSLLR